MREKKSSLRSRASERLKGDKSIIVDDYMDLPPGDLWNIRSLWTLMRHLFFKKGLTVEVLEHFPPILLEDGDDIEF